nr:hypothetical protein [Tanacetum cinerariifolium]
MLKPDHQDPNAQDNLKLCRRYCFHKFIMISYYGKDVLNGMGCDGEIDDMLRIKLREAEFNKEIFTYVAWIRAFNIKEPIYMQLCYKFYSTYEFDEVCDDDELQSKKIIKFRLSGRDYSLTLLEFARRLGLYHVDEIEEDEFDVYFQGGLRSDERFNIARKARVLTDVVLRSLSDPIYCRDLDTTTLRELIDSKGRLILEDPQPGVPRIGIPRPLIVSMQDLYDKMGSIEIRHEAIERMGEVPDDVYKSLDAVGEGSGVTEANIGS